MQEKQKLKVGARYVLPRKNTGEGSKKGEAKPLCNRASKSLHKLERPMVFVGRFPFVHGHLYLFKSCSGGYMESYTPLQLDEVEVVQLDFEEAKTRNKLGPSFEGLKEKRVSVIWEVQHREPGWIGRVRGR